MTTGTQFPWNSAGSNPKPKPTKQNSGQGLLASLNKAAGVKPKAAKQGRQKPKR